MPWCPPPPTLYYFAVWCVYIFIPVYVCDLLLFQCFFTMCFLPHVRLCPCMVKFLSPPPGPLVFPGPIFMSQREQALARVRPLQALRHKRDKHKGTTVLPTLPPRVWRHPHTPQSPWHPLPLQTKWFAPFLTLSELQTPPCLTQGGGGGDVIRVPYRMCDWRYHVLASDGFLPRWFRVFADWCSLP